MEKRIFEIQEIVRTLETENHKLICQNQQLKQSLSHSREKFKELDIAYKNEKEQLILELSKLTKELKSSKKTILQLKKNNIALNDLLVEKEALIRRMETVIKELQVELINIKKAMDEMSQDNDRLRRDVQEYQRRSEETKAKTYKNDNKEDTKQKLYYFQNLSKKYKLCIEQSQEALSDAKEDAQKLKEELHKTQEQNRQMKIVNIRLDDEMYALKKELNNYRKEREVTEQNLTNVKKDYQHYRENIEKLKNPGSARQSLNQCPEMSHSSGGDTQSR